MARHFGDDWLIPALDPFNESWFTAGKITVQSCAVESVAVVHHPVHPGLSDYCPYAIVVVSLDGAPGANAIGNILNRDPGDISIGQRVRAVFEPAKDAKTGADLLIPQWEVV